MSCSLITTTAWYDMVLLSHPPSPSFAFNTVMQGLMLWQPAVLGLICQAGCFTGGELKRLTQSKRSRTQGTQRESPSLSLITTTPPGFKFISFNLWNLLYCGHIRPINARFRCPHAAWLRCLHGKGIRKCLFTKYLFLDTCGGYESNSV